MSSTYFILKGFFLGRPLFLADTDDADADDGDSDDADAVPEFRF